MRKRSDRWHIVYKITCNYTGKFYIGMTGCDKKNGKLALEKRWKKHIYRANVEQSPKPFYEILRLRGHENFTPTILEYIKGKKSASIRECQLIVELEPFFNEKRQNAKKFKEKLLGKSTGETTNS